MASKTLFIAFLSKQENILARARRYKIMNGLGQSEKINWKKIEFSFFWKSKEANNIVNGVM